MQEAERGFGDHGAAVQTHTADGFGDPGRVAGEQLVIRGGAQEPHHAQLHYEGIHDLLNLALGAFAVLQIALGVDIEEGGHTTKAHCRAVLLFDRAQIAEVYPLHRFFEVLGGAGAVIAVFCRHHFQLFQRTDLIRQLFQLANLFTVQPRCRAHTHLGLLFLLDQEIHAVQRHAAIVADDAAAAVSIR